MGVGDGGGVGGVGGGVGGGGTIDPNQYRGGISPAFVSGHIEET